MQTPLKPGDICFHGGCLNSGVMCLASVPHPETVVTDKGFNSPRRATITYLLLRYDGVNEDGSRRTWIETCERDEYAFRTWLSVDEC